MLPAFFFFLEAASGPGAGAVTAAAAFAFLAALAEGAGAGAMTKLIAGFAGVNPEPIKTPSAGQAHNHFHPAQQKEHARFGCQLIWASDAAIDEFCPHLLC